MEITFLGTGTGETEQERFYTNLLIKHNDCELLIDCGDGISKQLLSSGLSVTDNINSILITHNHADHLGGLPALLTQMKICKRTKPLNLYIYHKSQQLIINLLNTFLLFPENFPFPFYIKPIIENENLEINPDLNIVAKINSHVTKKKYTTYFGEEVNPVSLSLLFNSKNGKIIYTGDIGDKEDLYLFDFNSVNYLITEATHIELIEIINLIKLNPDIKLVISHYSINKTQEIFDNIMINTFINQNRLIIAKDSYNLHN